MDFLAELMETANDRLELAKKGILGMSMLALLTCVVGMYNVYQLESLARKEKQAPAPVTTSMSLPQPAPPPTVNIHPWLRMEQKLDKILELLSSSAGATTSVWPQQECRCLPKYLVLQKPDDNLKSLAVATPQAPRCSSTDAEDGDEHETATTIYDEKPIEEILENYQELLVGLPLMPHMHAQTVEALNYDLRLDLPASSESSDKEGKEEEEEEEDDGSADELSGECYDNIPCSNHKKLSTLQRFVWF